VTETTSKETAAAFEPETEVNTMACQEMEAHQAEEEPTSADRNPEAAKQRKAPAEDAEIMPVGEPKKKGVGTENWPRSTAARKQKLRHGRIANPRKDWPSPAVRRAAV
jgi:hypothetical protein